MNYLFEPFKRAFNRFMILGVVACVIMFVASNVNDHHLKNLGFKPQKPSTSVKAQKSLQFSNEAFSYYSLNNYSKAKDLFHKSLSYNPSNDSAQYGLGAVYLKQKQYDNAKSCFKQALIINYKNVDALLGFAEIYEIEGNYEFALDFNKRALKIDRKNKQVKSNLIRLRNKLMY